MRFALPLSGTVQNDCAVLNVAPRGEEPSPFPHAVAARIVVVWPFVAPIEAKTGRNVEVGLGIQIIRCWLIASKFFNVGTNLPANHCVNQFSGKSLNRIRFRRTYQKVYT